MGTISDTQAEQALAAITHQYRVWVDGNTAPKIVRDFDWNGTGPVTAIVWEDGPYQWAYYAGQSYIEEEFGFRITGFDPIDGVFLEAVTSWAVGLYERHDA